MFKNLNIQLIISYLGLFPYIIITIDKYFSSLLKDEFTTNFIIYYTLIIIVFIGSTNWNLQKMIQFHIAIYGFIPSLFAIIIISLNLFGFKSSIIFIILITLLFLQLLGDYILLYSHKSNKNTYYFLRLPLTIIISIFLVILIS